MYRFFTRRIYRDFRYNEYLINDLIKADKFLDINKQTQFLVGSKYCIKKNSFIKIIMV